MVIDDLTLDIRNFHNYVEQGDYKSALSIVGKYFADFGQFRNHPELVVRDIVYLYIGLKSQAKTNEANAFLDLMYEPDSPIRKDVMDELFYGSLLEREK